VLCCAVLCGAVPAVMGCMRAVLKCSEVRGNAGKIENVSQGDIVYPFHTVVIPMRQLHKSMNTNTHENNLQSSLISLHAWQIVYIVLLYNIFSSSLLRLPATRLEFRLNSQSLRLEPSELILNAL
jgi:hypothetical protein